MKKWKLAFIIVPIVAIAIVGLFFLPKEEQDPTDGFYTYTVEDGVATIKKCDTAISGNVTVPATVGGYPVVYIGGYAFDNCKNITSIVLPATVKEIQMYAFENCTSLKSITIPKSVTNIAHSVFNTCIKLTGIWVDSGNTTYSSDAFGVLFNKDKTTLLRAPMALADHYTIPDSVKNIGERAFYGCVNLVEIAIADGITALNQQTFSSCTNLSVISLPESITSIGYEAFRFCTALEKVHYTGSKEDWNQIAIKNGNNPLLSAKIEYDYCIHSWNAGAVTRVPTCGESGIRTYTCLLCNSLKLESIPKLGTHTWNDGAITKAPTCKEPGVKTYTCLVCNSKTTENVEMLATHTWNSGIATKEPTCKETGEMTYTCKICGETRVDAIEMLTTHTPGEPATATKDQTCTVCGKVLSPATGETGFFGAIGNFFKSIGEFFENTFSSFFDLLGF